MPDPLPAALSLRVPTDLVFVRPARKMLEGLLQAQGWEEEATEEVALVATELLQNAIEHGSRSDGTEAADLEVQIHARSVILVVLDPGTGKDPRILLERDVTAPVPLDMPRGRGLFLINRLAATLERTLDERGGARVCVRMECAEP